MGLLKVLQRTQLFAYNAKYINEGKINFEQNPELSRIHNTFPEIFFLSCFSRLSKFFPKKGLFPGFSGFTGAVWTLNEWFKSYLPNRKQYLSINGYDSNLADVKFGVPQGWSTVVSNLY